jgi:GDPmannose 4,6-dehydratase
MFGNSPETPQNEKTSFHPSNPYGIAKLYAHWVTVNYRKQYGLFACSGICFNHESPRRGLEFVSRKITYGAARIKMGRQQVISLGNLDAKRDWGYARDYVEAMWLILQQESPEDYVIATGQSHTVRELCSIAFSHIGLDYRDHVIVDQALLRPIDTSSLVGDSGKARDKIRWSPKVGFEELVKMMVDADLDKATADGKTAPSRFLAMN